MTRDKEIAGLVNAVEAEEFAKIMNAMKPTIYHRDNVTLIVADEMAPTWIVSVNMTERDRSTVLDLVMSVFMKLGMKMQARIAAVELIRLMELESKEVGDGLRTLIMTKPLHDQAWMKAGISPQLGDKIAEEAERREAEKAARPGAEA